jgi:two-component system cell cycle sensor histidine kinase/response regulator CckA
MPIIKMINKIALFKSGAMTCPNMNQLPSILPGYGQELEMRVITKESLSTMNALKAIIYISDMDSFEILWANRETMDTFGEGIIGKICYEVLQNETGQCSFCTNEIIRNIKPYPHSWSFRNKKNGKLYLITDRVVLWEGREVRLK